MLESSTTFPANEFGDGGFFKSKVLSKLYMQVQDNTFSTILSALPISTLITSAAGIATKAGAAANEKPKEVKFSLTQEQRYIKTVYSQSTINKQAICTVGKPLTGAEENIGVAISDVGAGTTQGDTNADKNSDSITVNGTIKLPKSLQATPPANNLSNDQKAGPNGANGQTAPTPPPTQPKKKTN